MPDIIHIFLDSSVRCELTSACCVQHSHTSPAFFIFVGFFHFLLCCCIRTEVSKDKVLVCSFSTVLVKKRIVQVTEQFCIRRECSIDKLCQYLTNLIICIVDDSRIISAIVFIVDYFVCAQTEDKCIFFANFINDLNVSTIHSSQSRAPFSMNFMLPVPEASLLAVEICSETSAAAKIISALDTR